MFQKFYSILVLIFLTALATQYASGQNSVSGRITDDNNIPLKGANIIITNSTLGTASDNQGNYSLFGLSNGNYILRVSFSGYETIETQITLNREDAVLNFIMKETTIDLNAVVVTGTRTENLLNDSPVLTQLISKNLIDIKGVTFIPQILTSTDASFEMVKDNTVKSFKLGGLGPQYTLFLIDGERIAGETKGAVDLSRINPENIERIEIIKGAASTLYGSNAIGGVVNIITKTNSQPIEVSAGAESEIYVDPSTDKTKSDDYYFTSLSLSKNKFSSFTDGKLNKYSPFDLNSNQGVLGLLTQEKEINYNLSQKFIYRASSKLLFSAKASYYHLNRDFALDGYPDKISDDFTYGAKATYFTSNDSKLELSWHSDKNKIYDVVTDQGLENKILDYENLFQNLRFLGNYNLGNYNKCTAGLEFINEKQSSLQNNIEGESLNNFVIFMQDEISILEDLDFIIGARTDFHSTFGTHFTPQASAMYSPGNFKFRVAYGQGFRAPTVKELYTDHFEIPAHGSPIAFFLEGNADLEPEKSNYYSASAQYSNDRIDVSVNYSENHIENLITSDSIVNMVFGQYGPSQIDYIYSNVERANIKSIDLLAKFKIIDNLSFTGSYTHTDPKNETKETDLVNVRKHNFRANLDFRKRINQYGLTANLNVSYFGKKNVTDIYSHTEPQPTVKLSDFTLVNLTTTHTFKSIYTITLGINNIFDVTDDNPIYFNLSSPGRSFVAGLSIKI